THSAHCDNANAACSAFAILQACSSARFMRGPETFLIRDMTQLADLRRNYILSALSESDVAADPIRQFQSWFDEAIQAKLPEPNAMTLATVDASGQPSARIVLLKGMDAGGFTFFTNYESRKGVDLLANPHAALLFHWVQLERQVRVEGIVEKVDD